jgi:hypothetical protein
MRFRGLNRVLIPALPSFVHKTNALTPARADRVIIVRKADENPAPTGEVVPTQMRKMRIRITINQASILLRGKF